MFTPLISNFSYRSPSLKSFHGSMPRGCTSSSNCFLGQCPLPTSMAENNLSSREQSLCRRCRVNLQLFPWQIIFCGRRPFRGYLVVTFTKIVDHLITETFRGILSSFTYFHRQCLSQISKINRLSGPYLERRTIFAIRDADPIKQKGETPEKGNWP